MDSGIFSVVQHIDCTPPMPVGTAFVIDVDCPKGTYYLLTAYHVIEEPLVLNRVITVRDENGNEYAVEMEWWGTRQCSTDYALMKIQSDRDYERFFPMSANGVQACYVRGTSPAFQTQFLTLEGKSYGIEMLREGGEVLTVALELKTSFDAEYRPISDQDILGGFSGSPVILLNEKTVDFNRKKCIGVLGNLIPGKTVGARQLCVPMQTIIADCLQTMGLYDEYHAESAESDIGHSHLTLSLLFDDIDVDCFTLEDTTMEVELWNRISNQFYRRKTIDRFLQEICDNGVLSSYSPEVQVAIKYCYSRLLFKRNNKKKAFEIIEEIKGYLKFLPPRVSKRMVALIGARNVIEDEIKSVSNTLSNVQYATALIENLDVSDSYIANELASVYGRCLTNLFAIPLAINSTDKSEIMKICDEHTKLLHKYPWELRKQDVVNTSLNWFVGFWKMEDRDEDMLDIIKQGFEQSRKRKNTIFYIQCLLANSIYYIEARCFSSGFFLGLLAIKLMRLKRIHMDHEGVRQLFFFLKHYNVDYYFVFEKYYHTSNISRYEDFVQKLQLLKLGISSVGIIEQLRKVDSFFNDVYRSPGAMNPYEVPLSRINPFLS